VLCDSPAPAETKASVFADLQALVDWIAGARKRRVVIFMRGRVGR